MEGRGNWAVVGILLLGLSLAAFGWWWNLQRSKRCLQFWGPEAAQAIRLGTKVTAYQLLPVEEAANSPGKLNTTSGAIPFSDSRDISTVPGLLHARNSLLDDASFDWNSSLGPHPRWTHALEFRDENTTVVVLFDLPNHYLGRGDKSEVITLVLKSQSAWRTAFGARYFDDPQLLPQVER